MTGKEIRVMMVCKDLKQRWLLKGLQEKFPNLAECTLSLYLDDNSIYKDRPQRAEVLKEAERIVTQWQGYEDTQKKS